MRDDGDRGDEAEARGLAGDERGGGQLLVPVAARAGGKLAGVAVGIARLDVARDHHMVADRGVALATTCPSIKSTITRIRPGRNPRLSTG